MSAAILSIDGASKRCPRCCEYKALAEFDRNNRSPHGLACYCKQCRAALRKPKTRLHPTEILLATEKRCPTCATVKPTEAFSRDSFNQSGLRGQCKQCTSISVKDHYHRVKKFKRFEITVTEKRCTRCEITKIATDFAADRKNQGGLRAHCRACVNAIARDARAQPEDIARRQKFRIARRRLVMAHYGGRCACCGETQERFLAIDHVNGGGNKHRREEAYGNIADWLLKNGLPQGFRVLCHNCNMAIGFYGTCPHAEKSNF